MLINSADLSIRFPPLHLLGIIKIHESLSTWCLSFLICKMKLMKRSTSQWYCSVYWHIASFQKLLLKEGDGGVEDELAETRVFTGQL